MLAFPWCAQAQTAAARPAAAPSAGSEPQPPVSNIGNPPAVPGAVSVWNSLNTMCAGDRATLTASGGNGSYTWSPNTALSATTGTTVVVSPAAGSTTYTVTSTNPQTGAVTTATTSVFVRENCCALTKSTTYIVEVPGSVFNASTGSPFAGYSVGTRFHFGGASPIRLQDLVYQPPMGSTILMDGGKDLVLENGASLALTGVSITAACDDMWGRLWVRNTAAGISARLPASLQPGIVPVGTLRSQISHSLGGVEMEEAAAGGTAVPTYDFVATDFLHNEQSLVLRRTVVPGSTGDQLLRCTFDSQPESFKAPMAFAAGTANYPHYARYHVWFVGSVVAVAECTFRNALFGFHSPVGPAPAWLYVATSQFNNLYLAGVNVNSTSSGGNVEFDEASSTFTFPTDAGIQSRAQVAAARTSGDVPDQLPETRGIFTANTPLRLHWVIFSQPNGAAYSTFAFSERDKQVGIKAQRLMRLQGCQFTALHTGVEMSNVPLTLTNNSISANTFTMCRRGLEVHGRGLAARLTSGGSPPNVTVSLPLFCNTFDRGNGTRPGTAYGIYLDTDASVTFDPLNGTPAPVLTNKFLNYGALRPSYYAIFNANPNLAPFIKYTTFGNYIGPTDIVLNATRLGVLNQDVTLLSATSVYSPNAGQVCGFGNTGLERAAVVTPEPLALRPNPASSFVRVDYQVPPFAKTTEVAIRNLLDGQLLGHYALPVTERSRELDLRNLKPGVYSLTLAVNGVPLQTKRLVVE